MTPSTRWLSSEEERLWRAWVQLSGRLSADLQRDLQRDSALSLPDFDVLVHLTDDPAGRVRVSDLAGLLTWERSRLSHHLSRMERRGLLRREQCAEDGRGAFVVVTARGRDAIEAAAPSHVAAVRRLFFDRISRADERALARIVGALLSGDPGAGLES